MITVINSARISDKVMLKYKKYKKNKFIRKYPLKDFVVYELSNGNQLYSETTYDNDLNDIHPHSYLLYSCLSD